MAKQPSLAQIRRNFKIDTVMNRTGCTWEQAKAELIAEEWDTQDAVTNLKAWLRPGRSLWVVPGRAPITH